MANKTILVVDDNAQNVELLTALMQAEGYEVVSAVDGLEALAQVATSPPDLILLDIMMPKLDGYAVCRRLKQEAPTRLIPVVLLTALGAEDARIQGIEAGADDFITKPFSRTELKARVRSLLRLKAFTDELEHAEAMLLALGRTVEAKDPYTQGHCERLAAFSVALGREFDLPLEELTALDRGGTLHDLGKIGIPDAILLKPSGLNETEWAIRGDTLFEVYAALLPPCSLSSADNAPIVVASLERPYQAPAMAATALKARAKKPQSEALEAASSALSAMPGVTPWISPTITEVLLPITPAKELMRPPAAVVMR